MEHKPENVSESLSERNEFKQYEQEQKRHKKRMTFTITVCTIAAIVLFVYISFPFHINYNQNVEANQVSIGGRMGKQNVVYIRQDNNSIYIYGILYV